MKHYYEKCIWYTIPFFAGCILFVIFQKYFLTEFGLFSAERLGHMAACNWNSGVYFFYLLEKRLPVIFVIMILCSNEALWGVLTLLFMGGQLVAGFLFAECFIRYGMLGVVFSLAIGFPQMIFYLLGILYCKKCMVKRNNVRIRILRFLVYFIIMMIGVILEDYCNPFGLKGLIDKILLS